MVKSMPPKQVDTTVDKYAGMSKKQFIEAKVEELKKTSKIALSGKDLTSKSEGAWKEYSTKISKEQKKVIKDAKTVAK